jgi:sulfur carrier protein ThiS
MEEVMKVKVLVLGGEREIVEVPEGATVAEALRAANVSSAGVTCAVNGENAQLNHTLRDRQTITISNKVAGGR